MELVGYRAPKHSQTITATPTEMTVRVYYSPAQLDEWTTKRHFANSNGHIKWYLQQPLMAFDNQNYSLGTPMCGVYLTTSLWKCTCSNPKTSSDRCYESRNFLFVSNCITLIDGGVQRISASQEVDERIWKEVKTSRKMISFKHRFALALSAFSNWVRDPCRDHLYETALSGQRQLPLPHCCCRMQWL